MWRLGLSTMLWGSFLTTGILAQQPFAGPGSGIVFDPPTRSVRSIVGVSGAAYLGGIVLPEVDFASVAPGGKAAVFTHEGKIWVISWAGGEERRNVLSELPQEPQPIAAVWSSDGSAVVVTHASLHLLLNMETLEAQEIVIEANQEVVAVASAGRSLLLADRAEQPNRLYFLKPGNAPHFAGDFQGPAPVFISPAAALWVSAGGELVQYEIENAATITLAALDGVTVSALASDSSGRSVFVAGAQLIRVFNMEQRSFVREIAAEAPIDRLLPLTDSAFLTSVRSDNDGTVWIFDRKQLAMIFVPARAVQQ